MFCTLDTLFSYIASNNLAFFPFRTFIKELKTVLELGPFSSHLSEFIGPKSSDPSAPGQSFIPGEVFSSYRLCLNLLFHSHKDFENFYGNITNFALTLILILSYKLCTFLLPRLSLRPALILYVMVAI